MAEKGFKRKLTAILSADVEGYSRLMGDDEEATVRTLTAYREVLTTLIQQHNGKVLDSESASTLAMSFRKRSEFMGMASTLPLDWKDWLTQAASAFPRRLLIKLKASCPMDMNFWEINR